MYVRKRIGRRRSFYRRHRILIGILVCAVVGVLAFILKQSARVPTLVPIRTPSPTVRVPDLHPELQEVKYQRAVYPYSVIPGGIRTRAELVTHIANDPVVAFHYANFELSQAKFVRSKETVFVYVAYRLKDKIFWTAKTIKIPEGEALISDGNNVARTRCGNKISVLPQEPVSAEEPPVDTFEIPTFEAPMKSEPVIIASLDPPQLDVPPLPMLEPKPIEPLIPDVPVTTPRFSSLRYSAVRPLALYPQGNEIPEPGTISLLMGGLVVLFAIRFARKR